MFHEILLYIHKKLFKNDGSAMLGHSKIQEAPKITTPPSAKKKKNIGNAIQTWHKMKEVSRSIYHVYGIYHKYIGLYVPNNITGIKQRIIHHRIEAFS